jgi:hypothetical protein
LQGICASTKLVVNFLNPYRVVAECKNFVFAGDEVAIYSAMSRPSGSAKIEFSAVYEVTTPLPPFVKGD